MKTIRALTILSFFFLLLSGLKNERPRYSKLTAPQSSFDAVLSSSNSYILWGTNLRPYVSLNIAMFCSNPNAQVIDTTNFSSVDSVTINSRPLIYRNFWYVDTTFSSHPSVVTWKVYSSGNFPSFTYINNDSTPVYLGYNLLPDTILIGQNISINITNYNYADNVQVWLQNSDNHQTLKKDIDNNGQAVFEYTELAGLYSSNTQLSASVVLSKNNYQTIGGKNIIFVNKFSVLKNLTLLSGN